MKLIYVTDRRHIRGDVFVYLSRLLSGQPDALLVREKDLTGDDLARFVTPLQPIAERYHVPIILRGSAEQARNLGITQLQLSFAEASATPLPQGFECIGVSVHSLAEAQCAAHTGATSITYGHIFTSTCKPSLPPRGTAALDDIVQACQIPVYAIGGINASTLPFLLPIKPQGACLMSAAMTDPNPETLTTRLRHILERA